MYHIETPDMSKHMVEMKEHFDRSNFETSSLLEQTTFEATMAVCVGGR